MYKVRLDHDVPGQLLVGLCDVGVCSGLQCLLLRSEAHEAGQADTKLSLELLLQQS
jgi:hypothetical protein